MLGDGRFRGDLYVRGRQLWPRHSTGERETLLHLLYAVRHPGENTGASLHGRLLFARKAASMRSLGDQTQYFKETLNPAWQSLSMPIGSSNPLSGFAPIWIAMVQPPFNCRRISAFHARKCDRRISRFMVL
jgi:hypothetical protein